MQHEVLYSTVCEKGKIPACFNRHLFPKDYVYLDGLLFPDLNNTGFHSVRTSFPSRKDLVFPHRLPKDHAANYDGNGVGLFAAKKIPRGVILGEYGGLCKLRLSKIHPLYVNQCKIIHFLTRGSYTKSRYKLGTVDFVIDSSQIGNEVLVFSHLSQSSLL